MNSFSRPEAAPATAAARPSAAEVAKRKPVRVTITMSWATHEQLLKRSGVEGRSLSNLCAFLLEARADDPADAMKGKVSTTAPRLSIASPKD